MLRALSVTRSHTSKLCERILRCPGQGAICETGKGNLLRFTAFYLISSPYFTVLCETLLARELGQRG